jgi:hypothetical protein
MPGVSPPTGKESFTLMSAFKKIEWRVWVDCRHTSAIAYCGGSALISSDSCFGSTTISCIADVEDMQDRVRW